MPFNQYPITVPPLLQVAEAFTTEGGFISSALIEPEIAGLGSSEAYAEIYLATIETPNPQPFALLAAGYLGANQGVGWTGRIQLEPSYAVFVRLWCHSEFTFRVSFTTEH